MEELQQLKKSVDDHAQRDGYIMNSQAVYNFLDHISPTGGDCAECRLNANLYQAGNLVISRVDIDGEDKL